MRQNKTISGLQKLLITATALASGLFNTGCSGGSGSGTTPITPKVTPTVEKEQIVFERGGDIYSMNLSGTGERNLTNTPTINEITPSASENGKVAYAIRTATTTSEVWIMNGADGTEKTRLTPASAYHETPAISADGASIYSRGIAGASQVDIFKINTSTKQITNLTNSARNEMNINVSRNGTQLISSDPRDEVYDLYGLSRIWTRNSDGTNLVQQMPTPSFTEAQTEADFIDSSSDFTWRDINGNISYFDGSTSTQIATDGVSLEEKSLDNFVDNAGYNQMVYKTDTSNIKILNLDNSTSVTLTTGSTPSYMPAFSE